MKHDLEKNTREMQWEDAPCKAVPSQFYADLIERHAKLEKHAEDMAKCLDGFIVVDQSPEGELSFCGEWSYNVDQLVHAYRADFPKEG